jgi:hypothetical protein
MTGTKNIQKPIVYEAFMWSDKKHALFFLKKVVFIGLQMTLECDIKYRHQAISFKSICVSCMVLKTLPLTSGSVFLCHKYEVTL